jgi:uncharacterized protein DUF6174
MPTQSPHLKYIFFIFIALTYAPSIFASDPTEKYHIETINQQSTSPGLNARGTWKQNKLSNYVFTLSADCYCRLAKKAQIFVINDTVVKVINLDNGQTLLNKHDLNNYKTINQLFELIDEALSKPFDKINIEHDRYLGYPTKIYIDPSIKQMDNETRFVISNLKLLVRE